MSQIPYLVGHYLDYCAYAKSLNDKGKLDLRQVDFMHVTTLLPLSELISANSDNYIPPEDLNVANYIDTAIHGSGSSTYMPINEIPSDPIQREEVIDNLDGLRGNNPLQFGGENSFSYLKNELVGNIFDHSQCTKSIVYGQRYQNHTDLAFYDNGITIPENFRRFGYELKPWQCLAEAVNGLSTREESIKGYGLGSCVRICVEGLNGSILIVSGNACMHILGDEMKFYELGDDKRLEGTLITLRMKPTEEPIDIYQYLE